MGDLSAHFSKVEFVCKHCGELVLDPRLVPALEELRALAGVPIVINDAYRCPIHNAQVGGATHSEHLTGEAGDIVLVGKSLKDMYNLAIQVPAFEEGGIGLYDGGFIHVDVRGFRARWSRVAGNYGDIKDLL